MQLKFWYLPLLFLFLLTGCDNRSSEMYVSTQEKEEKRFKQNPNPQKQYRMTIRIENAPGDFERLKAFAHYQALNCTYKLEGPAGAIITADKDIPVEFKKISDNQYQGNFYIDALLNEDYYGQGVCDWQFSDLVVLFSATSAKEDTLFSSSITNKNLNEINLEINHLKEEYPRGKGKYGGGLSSGIKKTAFKPEEYFTFYVELEEI